MKCTFTSPTSPSCQRCLTTSSPCIVEGRKPRTPSQREALLAQIREKDAIIAKLLGPYSNEKEEGEGRIVMAGGKVVGAMEGTAQGVKRGMSLDSGAASRGGSATPGQPERATTMPVLGSGLGAAERAALMAVEKGGVSGAAAGLLGKKNVMGIAAASKKATGDVKPNVNANAEEESDEEWSSEEEGSDVWDEEVERRWGEVVGDKESSEGTTPLDRSVASASTNTSSITSGHRLPIKPLPSTAHLHPHALPSRDAPFGLIARLSLEEASERGVESEAVLANSKPPKKASKKRALQHPTSDSESDSEDPATPPNGSQSQSQLDIDFGIASPHYFSPDPSANLSLRRILNARAAPPPIIASGLIG